MYVALSTTFLRWLQPNFSLVPRLLPLPSQTKLQKRQLSRGQTQGVEFLAGIVLGIYAQPCAAGKTLLLRSALCLVLCPLYRMCMHSGMLVTVPTWLGYWGEGMMTSAIYAVDHVVKFPKPSPSVTAYCKQSITGIVEDLGMRLCQFCMNCSYKEYEKLEAIVCLLFIRSCQGSQLRCCHSLMAAGQCSKWTAVLCS